MNIVPSVSTTPPARESQHISDIYGGHATAAPGWPSVSSAPSPTQSPSPAPRNGFPLAAAVVLGFLVVSALFWVQCQWLALRKRRRSARAYPRFSSVHPSVDSVSAPPVASAGVEDENPFVHPRDEEEDAPFEASSLWRASTARSTASTLSI